MTARSFFAGLLPCVLLAGCGSATVAMPQPDVQSIQLIAPDGHAVTVSAELARTPSEQQRGLMGRTSLPGDSGMLFVFEESDIRSFWMKNTLIPLDIIFFDDAGRIISLSTMAPCPAGQATCPLTLSEGPARYALEMAAGFLEEKSVTRDWRLLPGLWASDS
ncbi:MAG: DUF192 domain-containing protein [Candidatus Pacebacteria bacterium]|nr:DUF192 domain-containing protein [Candidatus Paceibacterota bacterium]